MSADGTHVPPHHNFQLWGITINGQRALYFGSYATRQGAENSRDSFVNKFGLGGWGRGIQDTVILVRK